MSHGLALARRRRLPQQTILAAPCLILLLFASFASGTLLIGSSFAVADPANPGVMLGRCIGMALGIVLIRWRAERLGLARLSSEVSRIQTIGAGFLAGVGCTMSIFIGSSAFSGAGLASVKLALLLATVAGGGGGLGDPGACRVKLAPGQSGRRARGAPGRVKDRDASSLELRPFQVKLRAMKKTVFIASLALATSLSAQDLALPGAIDPQGYRTVDPAMAELGQLLFYDPVLSGNRNISCATCHHPGLGTADGVALSLGEGGVGLGIERVADPANLPEQHIPRHAPALWNLGHESFSVMFHDGRLELDPDRASGIRTPLGTEMEMGFASVLSAQSMFPVLSPDEMAGHYSENEIAQAVRMGRITGAGGAWDLLTDRIEAIPDYRTRFTEVFGPGEITFTQVSDALAVFIEFEWRADQSPFDAYLRGEEVRLSPLAFEGMELFYGELGCAACHSGPFQTDHAFHVTGLVQFGPGKRGRFEDHARDEGRFRVTGDPADLYAFRTPSLRNVAITDPYGHTGAYPSLETFLAAHTAPRAAWDAFDPATVPMPSLEGWDAFAPARDPAIRDAILAAVPYEDRALSDPELAALVAFLGTLTDPEALEGRLGIPDTVPSGLPVDR